MDLGEHLENEWYLVRYSGEIPEIAFHSSIYYLTQASQGPHLCLSSDQFEALRAAACERFKEIVLRDLDHGNVGSPAYRGIARSIANYQRFCTFCKRQGLSETTMRQEAAIALERFIQVEKQIVQSGERQTIINCEQVDLLEFCACLGADVDKRELVNSFTDPVKKTTLQDSTAP